jgi:hypothetical protein
MLPVFLWVCFVELKNPPRRTHLKKTLVVSIITLSLIASASLWAKAPKAQKTTAAATEKAPKAKMHVASGQIVSIDDSKLVLSHKVKGKEEQTSFAVNQDTKREGDLATGAKATVHYTSNAGENTATSVKAAAAKHVAKATAPKK